MNFKSSQRVPFLMGSSSFLLLALLVFSWFDFLITKLYSECSVCTVEN